jgi:hypothetical protein
MEEGIRPNRPVVFGSAPQKSAQRVAMPRLGPVGGWPTATGTADGVLGFGVRCSLDIGAIR